MALKQRLLDFCVSFVDKRLSTIQSQVNDIQESLNSETKSSAGDKHETGRAMLQLEREKIGHQLAEIQLIRSRLDQIDISRTSQTVALGSLVLTNQTANYFLSISAGAITIDDRSYYAIAPNTPVGKLLMGRSAGDIVEFGGVEISIEQVV